MKHERFTCRTASALLVDDRSRRAGGPVLGCRQGILVRAEDALLEEGCQAAGGRGDAHKQTQRSFPAG
jgi:hypothetical protein